LRKRALVLEGGRLLTMEKEGRKPAKKRGHLKRKHESELKGGTTASAGIII